MTYTTLKHLLTREEKEVIACAWINRSKQGSSDWKQAAKDYGIAEKDFRDRVREINGLLEQTDRLEHAPWTTAVVLKTGRNKRKRRTLRDDPKENPVTRRKTSSGSRQGTTRPQKPQQDHKRAGLIRFDLADGTSEILRGDIIAMSAVIASTIDAYFTDGTDPIIRLPDEVTQPALQILREWCTQHEGHLSDKSLAAAAKPSLCVGPNLRDLTDAQIFDLIEAASSLGIDSLLDACCDTVAYHRINAASSCDIDISDRPFRDVCCMVQPPWNGEGEQLGIDPLLDACCEVTAHRNASSGIRRNSPRVYDVEEIRQKISVKKLKRLIAELRKDIEPQSRLREYDRLTKGGIPAYMWKPDVSRDYPGGNPTSEEARLAREIYLLRATMASGSGLPLEMYLGASMGNR